MVTARDCDRSRLLGFTRPRDLVLPPFLPLHQMYGCLVTLSSVVMTNPLRKARQNYALISRVGSLWSPYAGSYRPILPESTPATSTSINSHPNAQRTATTKTWGTNQVEVITRFEVPHTGHQRPPAPESPICIRSSIDNHFISGSTAV